MPPPADRLYQVAKRCLQAVEDGFVAAGVNMPARRCVADGIAIFDCEQLTVQVERTYSIQGNAAVEQIAEVNCLKMRAATLAITMLRCCPTLTRGGDPPKVELIEASAQTVLGDAQLVWNALVAAWNGGGLAPYDHGLAFDSWQAVGPDGGLAGGTMRVRWALAAGVDLAS